MVFSGMCVSVSVCSPGKRMRFALLNGTDKLSWELSRLKRIDDDNEGSFGMKLFVK
jgi:hypothetical protein